MYILYTRTKAYTYDWYNLIRTNAYCFFLFKIQYWQFLPKLSIAIVVQLLDAINKEVNHQLAIIYLIGGIIPSFSLFCHWSYCLKQKATKYMYMFFFFKCIDVCTWMPVYYFASSNVFIFVNIQFYTRFLVTVKVW